MTRPQSPTERVLRTIPGTLTVAALLALGLPARSLAQAVTPTALAGTWAKKGQSQPYLTIKTDSTLSVPALTARWHLAGDTLVVDTILRSTQKVNPEDLRRVVTLNGKELTLTEVTGSKTARVYVRADSAAAAPAPTPPKP
jgi:hypothetical protein